MMVKNIGIKIQADTTLDSCKQLEFMLKIPISN